jgi:hypothetical protein
LLVPNAYCVLAFCFLEIILVVVIVDGFLFHRVKFNRVEADDLQVHSTLITIDCLAFVHVEINVNVGIAFWARSGRHCCYLQ